MIFDSPSMQAFNPKDHECSRRDNAHTSNSAHEHLTFTPSTKIPSSWRSLIMLSRAQCAHQKLIVAGSLQDVWEISGSGTPHQTMQITVQHKCRARGSRHENLEACLSANRILIYSPDTDVYNIGLPLTCITAHVECIVQINLLHSSEQRFVSKKKKRLKMMTQI